MKLAEIPQEVANRLIEPLAYLTVPQLDALASILGVEIIAGGPSPESPNRFKVSRLGLANSFINDAKMGLRLAVAVEQDGTASPMAEFIDLEDQYSNEEKVRGRKMMAAPVLSFLLRPESTVKKTT